MKSRNYLSALLLILLTQSTFAINYVTMNPGNWTDVVSVWSTDGGMTPCGCMPSEPTAGNNITVSHIINHDATVTITGGSTVGVEAYVGQLIGASNNIDVVDGDFWINGNVDISKLTVQVSGTATLVGYSAIQLNNKLDVYGNLNILGGYVQQSLGNVEVFAGGSMILNNYSKLELAAGNLTNHGFIYIDSTCCVETNGKWTNEVTGTVAGEGSARTIAGNMRNKNIWDPNIVWCSAGADFGMPSPEDCVTSNTICGALVLGVSFGDFSAEMNGTTIELIWNTITERENSHFLIERTQDGINYETIGSVSGAGTTQEEQTYNFIDYNPLNGKNHYRLKQVDFNAEFNYSSIETVQFGDEELGDVIGTYNTMGQAVDANYKGVVIDQYSNGSSKKRYQN